LCFNEEDFKSKLSEVYMVKKGKECNSLFGERGTSKFQYRSFLFLFFWIMVFFNSDGFTWELIDEGNGVKIYSKKEEKGKKGWTSFKAVGFYESNLRDIVEVLLDFDNKHSWAPQNKSSKVLKRLKNGNYLVLEHYKAPWPVDNREFLFEGYVKKNSDKEVLIHAWSNTTYPYKNDDVVIAFADYVDLTIEEIVKGKKCKVTFSVSGNLGGWIPNWVKKLVRTKWPFEFFEGLGEELLKKRKRNSQVFNELPFKL